MQPIDQSRRATLCRTIGQGGDLAQIRQAIQELADLYRAAGYPTLARSLELALTSETRTLVVVEAYREVW